MTTVTLPQLRRELHLLEAFPDAPVVTTCYLDVDGVHRPRMSDCLWAFEALARAALRQAKALDPALRPAVEDDLEQMRRRLHRGLDRARTRGIVLASCSLEKAFHTVSLPVPVEDRITVASRPETSPLVTLVENARIYGVALIDHQRLRMLEYQLGEVHEYPTLLEVAAPHHREQHAWSVIGSTTATGRDSAHWQPAGTHVDRYEANTARRHVRVCAAALAQHLAEHPVDALLLGGPAPERAQLERALREHHNIATAAQLSARVGAAASEVRQAIIARVGDIEGWRVGRPRTKRRSEVGHARTA